MDFIKGRSRTPGIIEGDNESPLNTEEDDEAMPTAGPAERKKTPRAKQSRRADRATSESSSSSDAKQVQSKKKRKKTTIELAFEQEITNQASRVDGAIETLQSIFAIAAAEKEAIDREKEAKKSEGSRREPAAKKDDSFMSGTAVVSGTNRQRRVKAQREDEQNTLYVPDNHPVLMGDVVVLENIDLKTPGFLMGDRAHKRCGIQQHAWVGADKNQSAPKATSLNYDNYAFRIVPKLKFARNRDLNEYLKSRGEARLLEAVDTEDLKLGSMLGRSSRKKVSLGSSASSRSAHSLRMLKEGLSSMFRRGGGDGTALLGADPESGAAAASEAGGAAGEAEETEKAEGSDEEEDDSDSDSSDSDTEVDEMELTFRHHATIEDEKNANFVRELQEGQFQEPVRFGADIHLMHVNSGLFLTVLKEAAPFDPDCRAVVLSEVCTESVFAFLPKFKAQAVGGIVYFDNTLMIESQEFEGSFLHTSEKVYHPLPNPRDLTLPKCLRFGSTFETNVSSSSAAFKIVKRQRRDPHVKAALFTRDPFRLYHNQSDSFVQASGDAEKGRSVGSFQLPVEREGGLRLHLPYLKNLAMPGAPQPSDPANHNSKQVWAFEYLSRAVAGHVSWSAPVRVRHVPSGKYLAVDTDRPPLRVTERGEEKVVWFAPFLVDDSFPLGFDFAALGRDCNSEEEKELLARDGDKDGNLDQAYHSSMIFFVSPMERADTEWIPNQDVPIRLEHRFEDHSELLGGGKRERVLYLHNSEEAKPWSLQRVAEAEAELSAMVPGSDGLVAEERRAAVHELLEGKQQARGAVAGRQLVFSSAKNAEDTFTLMHGSRTEADLIDTVKAFTTPVLAFALWVRDPSFGVEDSYEELTRASKLFLDVIALMTAAKTDFSGVDWIKKANGMLPAAFAKLFGGEPHLAAQNAACACKLIDAVFHATVTPYARTYPANPFADQSLQGVKGVQKLSHVALQRLTLKNRRSQMYFGQRSGPGMGAKAPTSSSAARRGGGSSAVEKKEPGTSGAALPTRERWMDSLTSQLEDPLGAAVTLAALLSASKELMQGYATPKFVNKFVDMVSRLGPQPRLVQFFQSLCIVNGVVVKQNQELVLRECWVDPAKRKRLFLDFESVDVRKLPQEPFAPVKNEATGAVYSSKFTKEEMLQSFPSEFLGQDYIGLHKSDDDDEDSAKWAGVNFEDPQVGSFRPVYVKWEGSAHWEASTSALFFPPSGVDGGGSGGGSSSSDYTETLGYPPIPSFRYQATGGTPLVRIEALCWVLAPESLCEPITGVRWAKVQKDMDKDPYKHTCFKRQGQLASYFLAELNLFSDMCANRSANCSSWLSQTFPFEMLVALSYSPHLPPLIRAAFIKLTRELYLDAFPQEPSCGRPSLPERLWVDTVKAPGHPDAAALPAIKTNLNLDAEDALPRFALTPSHPLFHHENPLLGFPTATKFFLCRYLATTYLTQLGHGDGSMSHSTSSKDTNELTLSVVENLVHVLLQFGFLSSLPDLEAFLQRAVPLLDGRNDIETYVTSREKTLDGGTLRKSFFKLPSQRYESTAASMSVTQLKTSVVKVMMDVADLRGQFYLSKILAVFKALCADPDQALELKKLHCFIQAGKVEAYGGDLLRELAESVEQLFVTGDGARMDFHNLTGGYPVNTVLLDCLMYESDALFEAALQGLERNFRKRADLLSAVAEVTLLETERVPVFGSAATMMSQVSFLGSLLDSLESWAVCSSVLGDFDHSNFDVVLATCEKLQTFMVSSSPKAAEEEGEEGEERNVEEEESLLTSKAGVTSVMKRSDFRVYDESTLIPKGKFVDRERQDILRGMNLHGAILVHLEESLNYNMAFEDVGSIAVKMKSRNMIVRSVRAAMDVLVQFVKGNPKNQQLCWEHLPKLLCLAGPLKPPTLKAASARKLTEEEKKVVAECEKDGAWPRTLGSEQVVIEILRGNFHLVNSGIPQELVLRMADLLDTTSDLSVSPLLEFFSLLCQPAGPEKSVLRNQKAVLKALLRRSTLKFRAAVHRIFFDDDEDSGGAVTRSGARGHQGSSSSDPYYLPPLVAPTQPGGRRLGKVLCRKPEKIVSLLTACVAHGNQRTAGILVSDLKVSLETVLFAITKRQRRFGDNFEFHTDPLLCSLTKLMGGMMQVLIVDPRLYHKTPLWAMSTTVGRSILDAFVTELEGIARASEAAERAEKRAQQRKAAAARAQAVARVSLAAAPPPSSIASQKSAAVEPTPLKVHKTSEEVALELREQEKGQVVLSVLSMCLNTVVGSRAAAHTGGRPTPEEAQWEKQLLGDPTDKFALQHQQGAEEEGQGEEEEAGEDDDASNYSSESGWSDEDDMGRSDEKEKTKSGDPRGGAAAAAAGGGGGADADDDAPHRSAPVRRRSSTALTAASVRASVEAIHRAGNLAGGGRGYGSLSGRTSKDIFDSCEALLRVICPLSPCLSKAEAKQQGGALTVAAYEEVAVDVSPAQEPRTVKDMFGMFSAAIAHNPAIRNTVNARRFTFAQVLEGAEDATDPHKWHRGARAYKRLFPSAVPVTWSGLVHRMHAYVAAHNFDLNEEHCIRVFKALTAHLLSARSNLDGTLVSLTEELEGDELDEKLGLFRAKQQHLNAHGLVRDALFAMATHDPTVPGNLADVAATFLMEVVRYGNVKTQHTVCDYLAETDKDAKVLSYLRTRLSTGREAILERQASGGGVGFQPLEEETREEYAHLSRALSFLTLLMDGHNAPLQNLLRHQPKRDFSIDLVTQTVELFVLQTANNHTLARLENDEVDLLTDTIGVLVEAMQGPCPENQTLITSNPVFFTNVERVMHTGFHARVSASTRLRANAAAIDLLAACLEGRTDTAVHDLIAVEMMPLGLDLVRHQLCSLHSAAVQGSLPKQDRAEALEVSVLGLVSLTRVYDKMRAVPWFFEQLEEVTTKRHQAHGLDAMDTEVGQVEVNWNGVIEVVSFRNPVERVYLSAATKARFEDTVDLRTVGKRTAGLLANTPAFIFEMRQISYLCERHPAYRQLYPWAGAFRWLVYALAAFLNLNLLMATVGSGKSAEFREQRRIGHNHMSNTFTVALGLGALIGYCILLVFFSASEIPLLIHKTDARTKKVLANPLFKKHMYRDSRGAFGSWIVGVVGVLVFMFLHWTNYKPSGYADRERKAGQNSALYETLALVFVLANFLRCCRKWIVVPDTGATRAFAVAYDLFFEQSFFLRYTLLIVFTIVGFSRLEFSTLLLLEILDLEFLLGAVVRCIVIPGRSLLLVTYLILCSAAVYAMFGLRHFEDADWGDCHSAVSCFWLIVYRHVLGPHQMMGFAQMSHRGLEGEPKYMLRMAYDLLWFIWMYLLFKLITGLLFGTFTKLNAAEKQRKDVLGNSGFVSGLGRGQYGDLGIVSPSFDELVKGKQNQWAYVNFLLHLTKKNKADFDGCESFVQKNLDEGSLEWLPVKTSFAIQALAKAGRDTSVLKSGEIVTVESTLAAFRKDFNFLRKDVKKLNRNMSKLVEATVGETEKEGGTKGLHDEGL